MTTKKLVYGVGTNDADYVTNPTINGKREKCKIYSTWQSMLERCYDTNYIEKYTTYTDCLVSEEWHSFMTFRAWMIKQNYKGKQLDKDLLFPGNKEYSKNTCVFISHALNNFMTDRICDRGDLPLGVTAASNKFMSRCNNPFTKTRQYLGVFRTPEEAHLAWKKYKHELALEYAKLETDPRIIAALQNRYK